ncbi:MAG TPA: molybdopterin cofactor-binding domain-containing protein [Bacteroidales bacterium]|nr:molybdopterin cofactor-binding domain-containing protein [Bacteroidales bacterium]
MKKIKPGLKENAYVKRTLSVKRRDFLKYLGGGMVIIFTPLTGCRKAGSPSLPLDSLPDDFNAFLHISEDGMVTCYTGKIEMGQGPLIALAQMMADELDVAFENVKMVMGDTDLCPWDGGTWGSTSIREFGPEMRKAAAKAREILLQTASKKLEVPVEQLQVVNGVVSDTKDNSKSISYAGLTKGKRIQESVIGNPKVKEAKDFKVIGKPHHRVDAIQKVTGEAKYAGDFKFPGMLFARIVRPVQYGAKLISADTSEAEKIGGIRVVRDKELVALLHEDRDTVDQAIVKVKAEFAPVQIDVNTANVRDHYLRSAKKGNVINNKGDIEAGRKGSAKVIESVYYDGYVSHSPIEPHAAVATMEGEKITVWVSAQTPFLVRDQICQELGTTPDKVRVIIPFVGGGFGGKGDNPQAVVAARLTKAAGKPVMVTWARDEEFFFDTLRPAALNIVKSGIDKNGKITFWDFSTYYCGDRGAETIYDVPHQKTTVYDQGEGDPQVHPFATGPWRAPGNSNNTFAREMQICRMAAAAGTDQVEFRLNNLKDERMIPVLKAVAEKFGYTPAKGPSGRGYGIALGTDVDTFVAVMVEVKVDKNTGHVQVVRASCAQDMGMCVNPLGTLMQIEGCITMGMGYSLSEELDFEGGNMLTQNWDTYNIPKFSWVPDIDAVILDRMDQPPHGGGEPAIICMGGAIASAIFDATGAVLYDMPMTPERVLKAIKEGKKL